MGAKAWFAAFYEQDPKVTLKARPELDLEAASSLAERFFPGAELIETAEGTLDWLDPENGEAFIGVYDDLTILAHSDFGIDLLSKIDPEWLKTDLGSSVYVHATHSVVDWLSFALWKNGKLVRALSVTSDDGESENLGKPLAFENPYWNGEFSVFADEEEDDPDDPYPLPFHPLELSEASMLEHLGFQFEGQPKDWVCDPSEIQIAHFKLKRKAWWKFW